MTGRAITRRTLLQGAAGAASAIAAASLPAWARPVRHATHLRRPDSLPFPHLPAGTPTMPQIQHIVVLIMENHSFDNLLGNLPHQVPGRASVDGLTRRHGRFTNVNRDLYGTPYHASHASSTCQLPGEPSQSWNASHESYDGGLNDGFVRASGPIAMRFWDKRDIPFTYSLASHFPIGERFFCSTLAQTFPNRRFFFAGTASGTIDDSAGTLSIPAANGTIWDRLEAHHIDWAVYYEDVFSMLIIPGSYTPARAPRVKTIDHFFADAAADRLPQFTFLEPNYGTTSEENPQDIQIGERFVARVANALMRAPTWRHTALLITYDEHGGYYDHVPPPRAIKPDAIAPHTHPGDAPGDYGRYGFRVPLIVLSPWARPGYVSHVIQDLTSLDAFIERKWNLPAMTYRDANAHPMTDYFDFRRAAFAKPPRLAAPPHLGPCKAPGKETEVARVLRAAAARS